MFDQDESSPTYGYGDRKYWAWGLSDFSNGSMQGAVNGLSKLLLHDLLQIASQEKVIKLIKSAFIATQKITRQDGSLEESFPYEGSYCVTALVAFDLLSAVENLQSFINSEVKAEFLSIVEPLIAFIKKNDENHAIISNHLATAAAAIIKWNSITGCEDYRKANQLLDIVIDNQSNEGWFREYEGPDPGYQSLAIYYLADIYRMRPDNGFLLKLMKSIEFLQFFVHPDGSFGGIYGSRNTRFYFPSGMEFLSTLSETASAISHRMRNSIANNSVITLSCIDDGNLIPMFNSYAWSATINLNPTKQTLPCDNQPFTKHFNNCGILIDRGRKHYSIINYSKGGVVYHFVDGLIKNLDCGVLLENKKGIQFSTQNWRNNKVNLCEKSIKIDVCIERSNRQKNSPYKQLILRILCLSIMRNLQLREFVKKLMVQILITKKSKPVGMNTRLIQLGQNLSIVDKISINRMPSMKKLDIKSFICIHMASQGYFQRSDNYAP